MNIGGSQSFLEVDIWSHKMANDSRLDVMVPEKSIDKLKNFLDTNSVRYEVVIDDLQSAIDAENPPLTDEDKEEFEGRKGNFRQCVYQF